MPTLRTKEPVGPTTSSQVLLASLLGRELHLKLTQTLRKRRPSHALPYILGLAETTV